MRTYTCTHILILINVILMFLHIFILVFISHYHPIFIHHWNRLSTGEIVFWWGIFIGCGSQFRSSGNVYYYTICSPVFTTALLLGFSGLPLLERGANKYVSLIPYSTKITLLESYLHHSSFLSWALLGIFRPN